MLVRQFSPILFFSLLFGLATFGHSSRVYAQSIDASAASQAMLILDASGSMWGKLGDKHKIEIARDVVAEIIGSWDQGIHLGLTAYGHRRKGDCSDIQTLIPIGPSSAGQVPAVVNRLSPKGKTPISDAVARAAEELRYTENPAIIILVTDGLETCNADPCAVAQALESQGIDFTAHVIGFDLTLEESKGVRCIADETGGIYIPANSAAEFRNAMESVVEASKPVQTDKVRLALVEGGPLLDSGNAQFRFFGVDDSGVTSSQQLAQNYGHIGFARVPPGQHGVNVKFGMVDIATTIAVTGEGSQHVVILNAGIVRLNAILSSDTVGLSNPLRWAVRPVAADGQIASQELTFQLDSGAGANFVLPAGKYLIDGQIGGVNKHVTVTVAAGDQTELVVDMRSGTVNLRALFSEDGEPAKAQPYFTWEAFEIDANGEASGKPLAHALVSTPKFALPAGKVMISFKDRIVKRLITVNVVADQTTNMDVVIGAGILNYKVVDANGGPVSGYPLIEFYPLGAEQTRKERLGYIDRVMAQVYVPAEPLDVIVSLKGVKQTWPIELLAGETQNLVFALPAQ